MLSVGKHLIINVCYIAYVTQSNESSPVLGRFWGKISV